MPELNFNVLKDSPNLKAYYRMESGALTTDSSGNGKTLTKGNGVIDGVGKFGGGGDLDTGTANRYLYIGDALNVSTVGSFSFWLKLNTEIAANSYFLFEHNNNTSKVQQYITYEYNGGTRRLLFGLTRAGGTTSSFTYNITLGTTNWNHFVFINNGSVIAGYLNNQLIGFAISTTAGTSTLSNFLCIGNDGNNINKATYGIFDDFAVFDTFLTMDQIKELYEGRTVGEGWPQAGLVAGYHLNGNSTDFSGNNNNGADTDITYSQANGKFNQGGGFGATSVIDIGNVSTLNFERTSPLTISAWIKPSAGLTYPEIICKQTSGGSYQGWGLFLNSASNYVLSFEETNTNLTNQLSVSGSILIPTDKFTHVVATYDGSSTVGGIKLYINGSLDGTINIKANNLSSTIQQTNTVKIGRRASSDGQYQGAIDELQLFNVAKDASWVRKQYALSVGKFI